MYAYVHNVNRMGFETYRIFVVQEWSALPEILLVNAKVFHEAARKETEPQCRAEGRTAEKAGKDFDGCFALEINYCDAPSIQALNTVARLFP